MKPMVAIDVERIKYLHSGLGQFCLQLATEFQQMPNLSWQPLWIAPSTFPLQSAPEQVFHVHGWHKWLRTLLPHTRVWHCTHQDSPYVPPKRPDQRLILTVHDLNFMGEKSTCKAAARLKRLQSKVDQADVLTAISRFTETEMRKHLCLRSGQAIHVIHNGAELVHANPVRPAWEQASGNPAQPFFLALGVIRPKKNFHVLIPMMRHFPGYRLFLAGPTDHAYADQIRAQIAEHDLQSRVFLVGPVSGAEKAWLYQNCAAFLFPSLLEGFGLPVIEAMHWGRPVVCSNLTSLPEVGGSCAWYWENFAPDTMASVLTQALHQCAQSPEVHRARIQQWASQFTWARAAQGYARLYQSLL